MHFGNFKYHKSHGYPRKVSIRLRSQIVSDDGQEVLSSLSEPDDLRFKMQASDYSIRTLQRTNSMNLLRPSVLRSRSLESVDHAERVLGSVSETLQSVSNE